MFCCNANSGSYAFQMLKATIVPHNRIKCGSVVLNLVHKINISDYDTRDEYLMCFHIFPVEAIEAILFAIAS